MAEDWFPDYVARWYDDFCAEPEPEAIDGWKMLGEPGMGSHEEGLMTDPHAAAARLNEFIDGSSFRREFRDKSYRRFLALRIASRAILTMGFRNRHYSFRGVPKWEPIWKHWLRNGNLLRSAEGILLPKERLRYKHNPRPSSHSPEDAFPGFVRWRPSDHPHHLDLTINVTVLPHIQSPGVASEPLRIAVVPLVSSPDDFEFRADDTLPNPCFTVSLRSPDVVERAAMEALERSASAECDIVIFPELCLTPKIQEALRERLVTLGVKRPWLLVAGSALTPVGPTALGEHYNQSLVFSGGKQVLTHHKLFRYELTNPQQERYGVHLEFGGVDRFERMATKPRRLEVLETSAGRIAVLICEDLSVEDFVKPLVVKLGIDWLFVPVLDGCQTKWRWTAKFGRRYAENGAIVVVATSHSLAQKHGLTLSPPVSPPAVGLIFEPSVSPEAEGGVLARLFYSEGHDHPTTNDLG